MSTTTASANQKCILWLSLIITTYHWFLLIGYHIKFGRRFKRNIGRHTPHVGRVAQRKKSSTNSTAWLWFWDIKETQNCYLWKKILSHHGDITWHTQPIQPKYGRILLLCTTSPPIWLKISFHFCPFWVPFLSLNHNQAVEIIELFFPLSYPSKIGWQRMHAYFL